MKARVLAVSLLLIACPKQGVFAPGAASIVNGAGSTVGITLPVKNPGSSAIAGVTITSMQLGQAPLLAPTTLPVALGDIAAGQSFTLSASFDGSGLTAGAGLTLAVSGTYAQGTATVPFTVNVSGTLPPPPDLAAGTNKTDDLVFEAQSGSGDVIDYFGPKDASGLATGLSGVTIQTKSGDVVSVGLDATGRPTSLSSSSGTFTFAWTSATAGQITATSADGSSHVTIPFDAATATPLTDSSMERASATAGTPLIVHVDDCGPADDAVVGVHYIPSGAFGGRVLPGNPIGNGDYSVDLPTPQQLVQSFEMSCEKYAEHAEGVCTAAKFVLFGCAALAASTVVGAPLAVSCTLGAFDLVEACEINSGSVESDASLFKGLCTIVTKGVDLSAESTTVQLRAVASAGGAQVQGDLVGPLPAAGPFQNMSLTIPAQPVVSSFTADPGTPPPGSGYTATASVRCVPTGTSVLVEKDGADGHSANTCQNLQGNASCQLSVGPAGAQGSRDTLTAQVVGPDGKLLTTAELTVVRLPAALTVSPATLSFTAAQGGANPASQSLSITSDDPSKSVTWAATTSVGDSWLTISPSTGTTPGSISVGVNIAGLAAGSYNGSISIPAANRVVPVTLQIASQETFSGSYSASMGNVTDSVGCQYSVSASGTLTLAIQEGSGSLTGTASSAPNINIQLVSAPANTTCTASPFSVSASGAVSGNDASLTASLANSSGSFGMTFHGSRSGSTISGSASLNETLHDNTGASYPVSGNTGNFALAKQ